MSAWHGLPPRMEPIGHLLGTTCGTEAAIMAGRQRSMARKVAALQQKSDVLFATFSELMPELYRERLLSNNPLSMQPVCEAWGNAWAGISSAHKGLVALRELLEQRAASLPQPPVCLFIEPTNGKHHSMVEMEDGDLRQI